MPSTVTICRKIIITGTGRAGTTFLVRLLTELGLDTGFTRETWRRDYHEHCSAGLEHDITAPDAPYIVKNPALCTELEPLLAAQAVEIDFAIIPVRELKSVASSRARVGGSNGNVPGGLWLTDDPNKQEAVMATIFHQLVHTLVAHEIPFCFLHFPRFVNDPRYAFAKLAPLLKGVEWRTFEGAFKRIADPTLVHDFSKNVPGETAGKIGDEYLANKKRLRRKRRLRRTARLLVAVAAAGLIWMFAHQPQAHGPRDHPEVEAESLSSAH